MEAVILGLLIVFGPYTVGGHHLPCANNKCPQLVCLEGWSEEGYDMSGRKFIECRTYTASGRYINNRPEPK